MSLFAADTAAFPGDTKLEILFISPGCFPDLLATFPSNSCWHLPKQTSHLFPTVTEDARPKPLNHKPWTWFGRNCFSLIMGSPPDAGMSWCPSHRGIQIPRRGTLGVSVLYLPACTQARLGSGLANPRIVDFSGVPQNTGLSGLSHPQCLLPGHLLAFSPLL